jgi:thiol-disulfide isomerase/thioredoxin
MPDPIANSMPKTYEKRVLMKTSHPLLVSILAVVAATVVQFPETTLADEHFDSLKVGGDTYTDVTVTMVTATDIYFTFAGGMSNAKLKSLDPDLQKHFAFNAEKAAAVEKSNAQATTAFHQQVVQAQPPSQSQVLQPGPPLNVSEGLDIGQRFPGFDEADSDGNSLSVSAYRGHVTMIDFWATWCPPCRGEMPNVIATYKQYHSQGFEIIGVSLDDDRGALGSFTQSQGMTWRQYFDGLGWNNKLVKQYGVDSIPMDYLLDRNGIIVGKGLRGARLGEAVAKALAN